MTYLQLGISQEQLGSIFADVQEKLGEFTATEGGGAKDFFDALKNNTKMTEDQIKAFGKTLQGKDGVEAIQALKNKMDEMGASSQEQRFVFESLASDLGNLMPLFADGGDLLGRYGSALEEAGIIKSKEAIEQSRLLAAQTQSVQTRFEGFKSQLSGQMMPVLNSLLSGFLDGEKNGQRFGSVIQAVGLIAKGTAIAVIALAGGISNIIAIIKGFVQQAQNIGATAVNVWNADGIKAKAEALSTGLKTAWSTAGTTISSVVDTSKQTIQQMNNIIDSATPKLDKLGQLYYDTGEAAKNSANGLKTNTEEAKENEKATKKLAAEKAKLAKEQENLNKMVGASALTGLRIKSAEAFAGGNVRAYTASFAQMSQTALGKGLSRFTAFNDLYHKGTNSKHATGNAFDFTIADAKKSGEAVSELESIAKRYGYVVKILDEYKKPSSRATGGHIHVSVLGFKGTAQMQKDAQAELDIIGKTNEDALKIQEDRAKNQLAISLKLGGDLNKIETENQESIEEIKKAFVEGDPNRAKYLQLQALMYKKDLEEFKKNEQQKRAERFEAQFNPLSDMQSMGINALAQTSLIPLQLEQWQLQQDQQGGYSQLGDSFNNAIAGIDANEMLNDEQKAQERLSAYQAYLDNKIALTELYSRQEQDLQNSQQAASLAGYGAMFGMMGSMLDAYGAKNSVAYQAAFALQKGFVLSSALLNAKNAIMSEWGNPAYTSIWQKMAGVAAVVVKNNELMSAIQGVSLTGMAHDGIANIPQEGTWLLNKGERVLNPQDNKAFTNFINQGDGGGNIEVNVYTLPGETADVSWNNGELDVRIRKVSEQNLVSQLQNPNSPPSKAIKQNFNTTQKR
ncbi:hypothetical protein QR665_14680 [Acinetobacter gerneri]|uniref:hypothetical protein n=1 Tax=Acinetobacter gerneri TaxID=202952 RepID=UPI0029366ABF|nr:hypothetical protein [Acinetobacter gerneri]MDV2440706.1 hypothetical protein [Acinetobacter gerneri]